MSTRALSTNPYHRRQQALPNLDNLETSSFNAICSFLARKELDILRLTSTDLKTKCDQFYKNEIKIEILKTINSAFSNIPIYVNNFVSGRTTYFQCLKKITGSTPITALRDTSQTAPYGMIIGTGCVLTISEDKKSFSICNWETNQEINYDLSQREEITDISQSEPQNGKYYIAVEFRNTYGRSRQCLYSLDSGKFELKLLEPNLLDVHFFKNHCITRHVETGFAIQKLDSPTIIHVDFFKIGWERVKFDVQKDGIRIEYANIDPRFSNPIKFDFEGFLKPEFVRDNSRYISRQCEYKKMRQY